MPLMRLVGGSNDSMLQNYNAKYDAAGFRPLLSSVFLPQKNWLVRSLMEISLVSLAPPLPSCAEPEPNLVVKFYGLCAQYINYISIVGASLNATRHMCPP